MLSLPRPSTAAFLLPLLLAFAACNTQTAYPQTPPAQTPSGTALTFLHTHGEDIINESGNKVMLRGVGLGNWMLPEGYMWHFNGGNADRPRRIEKIFTDLVGPEKAAAFWKAYRATYISEADIKRIAELGFNSCRPALDARMFLSEDGKDEFHQDAFDTLDNLVKWCKANNIYVIIDMHAAPGGETGANIDDSVDDRPLLFMEPQYEQRLTKLWLKIADRYKNEPTVAAYDLLNEPLPKKTGSADKYKQLLQPLYERLTKAIRTVDKNHMVTVEGADWANDWSVFTTAFDSNMVHQFHYYCWDNPTNLKGIQQYLDVQKKLHTPIWVGETGERDATIYWATTDLFESNNIGWSFWPWKKTEAANGIYSAKLPAGWDAITNYAQDPQHNPKPSPEVAEKALAELLENVKLENCTYTPSTVNSLFHRLPVRVEAENYGHQGPGKSYFVKDTSKNSPLYRKSEPVQIEAVQNAPASTQPGARRRRNGGNGDGGQAIHLNAGEWTAYQINNPEEKPYTITIKLKADALPASLKFLLNNSIQTLTPDQTGWVQLKLPPTTLPKGPIDFKIGADIGSLSIDWINFETP